VDTDRDASTFAASLRPGETVQVSSPGTYLAGQGVLAATERRLLFAYDGAAADQQEQFPYPTIRRVVWRSGLLTGALSLRTDEAAIEIGHLDRKTGRELADYVRARLAAPQPDTTLQQSPAVEPAGSVSTLDQLRWLVDLHESGGLTDAEFAAAKARLLDL